MVIPASLVAQMVKNLAAMQETQVWSLGQEDSLEKEMATHSNILAWENPWIEATVRGMAKSRTWLSNWHFHFVNQFNTVPRIRGESDSFCSFPRSWIET